jgi:hypothetical protein
MTPRRIQLQRRRGWRLPPNTVVVSRPTRWGNPHRVGWCDVCKQHHSRAQAVAMFARDAQRLPAEHWRPLRGRNLACWCAPNQPCHADVLLHLASGGEP